MTELIALNTKNLALDESFNPLFSQIHIYGTAKAPLFLANDVVKVLGIADLNIRHKPEYKENTHFVYHTIKTTGGAQKVLALTEFGLYKAMFSSTNAIAELYCQYIVVVMSELRTQGVVTTDSAMSALNASLIESRADYDRLASQYDDQHYQLVDLQERDESMSNSLHNLNRQLYCLRDQRHIQPEHDYAQQLEKHYMKPVHVHCKEDEDDMPDNTVYTFKCSTKKQKGYVETLYMVDAKQAPAEQECSLNDLREQVAGINQVCLR